MILPESLWPGMTRHGFSYRTNVPVRPEDRFSFPVTDDGMWLSKVETSACELDRAKTLFERQDTLRKRGHYERSLALKAFDRISLDQQFGC